MTNPITPEKQRAALETLIRYFQSNGYVRLPNLEKRKKLQSNYKKGYELRFVADTKSELREIRQCLQCTGFGVGKPFVKGRQFVQPVYGKKQLDRFLAIADLGLEQL